MTNKSFYLAVDNRVSAKIPWKYFRFMRRDAENRPNHPNSNKNPSKNRLFVNPNSSNLLFKEFGVITNGSKSILDLREVRNACIRYLNRHKDEAYCIHILKRIRKDVYEQIEFIYPSGISEIDDNNRGYDWITDYYFNEENTFEL